MLGCEQPVPAWLYSRQGRVSLPCTVRQPAQHDLPVLETRAEDAAAEVMFQ